MDSNAKNELNSIIYELNSIISELEEISNGIRKDFKNIGNDKCADCIDNVITQYKSVRKKLLNMDTNKVTDEFAQSHGGGGRRIK